MTPLGASGVLCSHVRACQASSQRPRGQERLCRHCPIRSAILTRRTPPSLQRATLCQFPEASRATGCSTWSPGRGRTAAPLSQRLVPANRHGAALTSAILETVPLPCPAWRLRSHQNKRGGGERQKRGWKFCGGVFLKKELLINHLRR